MIRANARPRNRQGSTRDCAATGDRPYRLRPVLAACAVLLSFAAMGCRSTGDSEKTLFPTPKAQTLLHIAIIQSYVNEYQEQHNALPPNLDVLSRSEPPLTSEPNSRLDDWQRPIEYRPVAGGYELRSAGAEGVFGSADDIKKVIGPRSTSDSMESP